MKGNVEDYWWVFGGLGILVMILPTLTAIVFPTVPPSPCLENVTVECDEWSPECNINITVEEVSGPYYDQKIDYIETYNREVCIEYENGTRVMP